MPGERPLEARPAQKFGANSMLASLKRQIETLLPDEDAQAEGQGAHALQLAAAALLLEAARADDDLSASELRQMKQALVESFEVHQHEIDDLMQAAQSELDAATCLHQITATINGAWDLSRRVALVQALWEVVLSDSFLDSHERHLMRKLQGLLHVPQSEYIAAKMRASEKLLGAGR